MLSCVTDCSQHQALERYGPIATVVPPRLLAMALAVYDSQAGTGRMVNLPDWTREWSYDSRYRGHPLYRKTLHYRDGSTTDNTPELADPAGPAPAAPPAAAIAANPTPAPAPTLPAPPAQSIAAHLTPAPTKVAAAPRKPKSSQAAVTFDASGPSGICTPPEAGPSHKRTFSGSSSNKSGRATPKRRKFKVSPKSKIATRTGRLTRASKVLPAKSKHTAKSNKIVANTDDEQLEKMPDLPAAKGKGRVREYVEILDDDYEDDAEEAGRRKLPAIVVGKKMKKVSPSLLLILALPYLHPPVFF